MLLVVGVSLVAACPSTPPPACITVDTTCAPGYVPTFDNVYTNTLKDGCGSTRSSCHSQTGHMGGLSMQDEATAYADLMAMSPKYQRARVTPGDPACSLMIVRTDSPGADYQMPPGDPLTEPERCALIQWVQMGAPGPGSGM
jgi:cytochrome c